MSKHLPQSGASKVALRERGGEQAGSMGVAAMCVRVQRDGAAFSIEIDEEGRVLSVEEAKFALEAGTEGSAAEAELVSLVRVACADVQRKKKRQIGQPCT